MRLEPHVLLAGRYRVIDVLAEGGMGVVYRAHDQRLDRLVAVKTVRQAQPETMDRLRREAHLLAQLTHPNVVSLYDVGEHDGQPYLVTQFVDGVPLRQLLGRMTTRHIAWVGEQIANGLAAAHTLGIVHRDLKPSNVLVGDGTVRLLDFGIARHIDERTPTRPDAIVGTASYISPEQLRGDVAGPPADVYALGLVFIECFSGRAAFPGTFAETVAARMAEAPEMPPSVPPAWRSLIGAMTHSEPGGRPSALAVASAMRALARTRPGAAGAQPVARDTLRPGIDARPGPAPASGPGRSEPRPAVIAELPLAPPSRTLVRPALVVPVAAAVGFLLVLGVGAASDLGRPGPAAPLGARPAVASQPEPQAPSTLPVTVADSVTAPSVEPTTTVPPTTAPPPTTPAPTTRPPTTPAPPPTTAAPTTRRPTTTTRRESEWERRVREWREQRRRRGRDR